MSEYPAGDRFVLQPVQFVIEIPKAQQKKKKMITHCFFHNPVITPAQTIDLSFPFIKKK